MEKEARRYRVPVIGVGTIDDPIRAKHAPGDQSPGCCVEHCRSRRIGPATDAVDMLYECCHVEFWTRLDSDPSCVRLG